MSVLIKSMEMPGDCGECRFGYDGKCFAVSPIHRFFVGDTFECPLIEIPPHGRLIDADALTKTISEHVYPVTDYFNSRDYGMFWTGGIEKAINEQPTIIEAEE